VPTDLSEWPVYRYIGPAEILARVRETAPGNVICCPEDVRRWVRETKQVVQAGSVVATFVVDSTGMLRIADRCSEHVACAGGQPVRSAGEMTFQLGQEIEILEVSNQSTGYCPAVESWGAVARSLVAAGFSVPEGFALSCEFRRCLQCGDINLVKDGFFVCGSCEAELPARYNVQ
jgi:hypothetical protein